MRWAWLTCMLIACGGATAEKTARPATAAHEPSAHVRHVPTRAEMLATLPGDVDMVFAFDIDKLRQSPIAKMGWDMVRDHEKMIEVLALMCGTEDQATYVIAGMAGKSKALWAWQVGVPRGTGGDCAKARDFETAHHYTTTKHGDYELTLTDKQTMEALWFDDRTQLIVMTEKGQNPLGEAKLAEAVQHGALTSQTPIGQLLEHVNVDAGAVVAVGGAMTKVPGMEGVAISVEADDSLRAQLYVKFDDEDRAINLRTTYRTTFDKALASHLIESGESRVDGSAMASSVTMTRKQVEWWIDFFRKRRADPNGPPPPPPQPSTSG